MRCRIDSAAERTGCIREPFHCELSPSERIWAQMRVGHGLLRMYYRTEIFAKGVRNVLWIVREAAFKMELSGGAISLLGAEELPEPFGACSGLAGDVTKVSLIQGVIEIAAMNVCWEANNLRQGWRTATSLET
ncbi:hypothetical protein HPB48_027042 [Haemaphysalis longicornis]|uniref:Uncharacterized protein n=1 Tax=Haemaphysalis longicornis TaxID=44386 RepID=A0A9J6HAY7_HAELO|nr:hypothetical protein HPB48_027042 [Haemaphysalis longicornis]